MSCNGCRALRKGCNDNCMLRQSLQGIESAQAQANATIFVGKFFGRADLMSFISAVSKSHRPALFQSLLFEACGRTINPVTGAVGLLWTGNSHLCQSAVDTVLRGGEITAMPELVFGGASPAIQDASETDDLYLSGIEDPLSRKRKGRFDDVARSGSKDLDLGLANGLPARMMAGAKSSLQVGMRRRGTPSMNSEESETTTFESGPTFHLSGLLPDSQHEAKLLRLFF